jgi:hypothetical protein
MFLVERLTAAAALFVAAHLATGYVWTPSVAA